MDSDRTPRRKDVKTLKQQLPYPYNQDLSKILRLITTAGVPCSARARWP